VSDERGLEELNSHPRKSWFEGPSVKPKEPDCGGPYPEHRPMKSAPAKKAAVSPDHDLIMFARMLDKYVEESRSLLFRKQKDYGPLNIANAPGGALNGLRVRIFDKVSRINNLIDTGATPEHESLRDSFIDLANYGLIALMVLDGVWPELPKEKK